MIMKVLDGPRIVKRQNRERETKGILFPIDKFALIFGK